MLARMNDFGFGLGGAVAPLLRLHDDMNRLFEGLFEDMPDARPYGAAYPALNTWEDGDTAYVEAELPGLGMDDVEILVSGNEVTINGQRKIEAAEGATWHRRERSQGKFSRVLSLPWEIDADKVEARLRDGVLTVRLPKCESCKPKKVKVLTA
jgi:HSP20 family protein